MGRDPVTLDIVTLDGWTTCYPEWFTLYLHPPPRPYGYLRHLRVHSRFWWPRAHWALAFGLILMGCYTHWAVAAVGGGVLGNYGFDLWTQVHSIRTTPLITGILRGLKPHPRLDGFSVGAAFLPDGTAFRVCVYTPLAGPLIEQDGRCEAIFFPNMNVENVVLGVRPAPTLYQLPSPSGP
jgi:hypothetical protein